MSLNRSVGATLIGAFALLCCIASAQNYNKSMSANELLGDKPTREEYDLGYTGVRHVKLFDELGLPFTRRIVGRIGVEFSPEFGQEELVSGGLVSRISITVLPTEQDAIELNYRRFNSRSVGPGEVGTGIGSWYALWSIGDKSGSMLLREENISIDFPWKGGTEEAKELARKIVALIRTDREVALRGVVPSRSAVRRGKLTLASDPEEVHSYRFPLEFEGTDYPTPPMVSASSVDGANRYIVRKGVGEDFRIVFPGGQRPERIQLNFATEENFFFSDVVSVD